MTLHFTRRDCRVCASSNLVVAIPLESIPVASPNVGLSAAKDTNYGLAPLNVYQCKDCSHIQLLDIVDPSFMYENFQYTTSVSKGLKQHFEGLVGRVAQVFGSLENRSVFEIGSNDGTLLGIFREHGAKVLGLDPAVKAAKIAQEKRIQTIVDFFTASTAKKIANEHGQADIVVTNYTLANIDDLADVGRGIETLLAPGGLLVIETSYGADVIAHLLLDSIYHEHLSYFLVTSMQKYVQSFGFQITHVDRIETKGGSIRVFARRSTSNPPIDQSVDKILASEHALVSDPKPLFNKFNVALKKISDAAHTFISRQQANGVDVVAFGAAVGSMPLISQFRLWDKLTAILDDNPLTDYFRGAQYRIPVMRPREVGAQKVAVILLAWRYEAQILPNIRATLGAGTEVFIPFPEPRIEIV